MIEFRRSAVTALAALAVSAMLFAACSSTTGAARPTTNADTPAAASPGSAGRAYGGGYGANDGGRAAATATPPAAADAAAYEVETASGSTGMYLTGEDGKALYVFKKDPPNRAPARTRVPRIGRPSRSIRASRSRPAPE